MAKPLTHVITDALREAIRKVAIDFQSPNITIIGMLEIIQSEISREEMLRLLACVHDWVPDEEDNKTAVCSRCGETDSIDIIGMSQE